MSRKPLLAPGEKAQRPDAECRSAGVAPAVLMLASVAVPPEHVQSSEVEETCTPVTPDQKATAFRNNRLPGANNTNLCLDGGIALGPSDATCTSKITNNGFPGANIRIRRSHHACGSTLLQSPARAGHAARMRQIFEDAGREQRTPQDNKGVLYPQLPNISRRTSPPPEYRLPDKCRGSHCSPSRRPESLCMSTNSFRAIPQPQVNSVQLFERESESWSDDSGYFIGDSRIRPSAVAVPPKERIYDWLQNVSEPEVDDAEDVEWDRSGSRESLQRSLSDLSTGFAFQSSDLPLSSSTEYKRLQNEETTAQDPFIQPDHENSSLSLFSGRRAPSTAPLAHVIVTPRSSPVYYKRHDTTLRSPSKHRALEDGGVQLSPLSPNVCVERGPARYHTGYKNPNMDHTLTPTKERPALFNVGRLTENLTVGAGNTTRLGSPLAPCKIGVGTRFQHPRHNSTLASSRFGPCTGS
ncbi:hypothetical protein EJ02DRAFT_465983 [Clathrospora elynae]|uniref:Uncharacterized protein n=1 Tax=Clathrospora elynae TaxID=706981 RepID=A0A6A5SNE0_9PLEO|nr:hypothetical protein EJ02DRAFT_465983 [Clathrospora elynae]